MSRKAVFTPASDTAMGTICDYRANTEACFCQNVRATSLSGHSAARWSLQTPENLRYHDMSNRLRSHIVWLCVQANPIAAHAMDETVMRASCAHRHVFIRMRQITNHICKAFHQPHNRFTAAAVFQPNIFFTSNST
jgi:hypothetical protein